MIGRILFSLFILHCFFIDLLAGQNAKDLCDENTVNMHMLQCYQHLIDPTIDATSAENAFYLDGDHLCQAFNGSSLFRQCFYSIFTDQAVCDKELYPFSYEYSKIFWKLVMSSCAVNHLKESCHPSHLSQQTLLKCHYSFDDKYPTRCREFLQSVQCMSEHEYQLISSHSQSTCSMNKAFYYYYGDLAARLQLSINVCEQQ